MKKKPKKAVKTGRKEDDTHDTKDRERDCWTASK